MMIYDAFVRRVISSNKQVFNKLAPIMMLLRKNTFKKVKLGANGPWGGRIISYVISCHTDCF